MADIWEGLSGILKRPLNEVKELFSGSEEDANKALSIALDSNKMKGIMSGPIVGGALSDTSSGVGWQGGAQLGNLGPTFDTSTAFGGAQLGQGGTGAMGMNTAYAPTTEFGAGAGELLNTGGGGAKGGFDWTKLAKMAENLKGSEQPQQVSSSGASVGGRWGGFNSKLYQNPLLEKEYMRIYTEPSFKQPR